jgi:hypothetical protein
MSSLPACTVQAVTNSSSSAQITARQLLAPVPLITSKDVSSENLDLPSQLAPLYGGASVDYALRKADETPLDLIEHAAALMRSRKTARKSTLTQ